MRAWNVLSRPCKSAKTSVGVKLSVCSLRSNACGRLCSPEAARSSEIPGACCSQRKSQGTLIYHATGDSNSTVHKFLSHVEDNPPVPSCEQSSLCLVPHILHFLLLKLAHTLLSISLQRSLAPDDEESGIVSLYYNDGRIRTTSMKNSRKARAFSNQTLLLAFSTCKCAVEVLASPASLPDWLITSDAHT